MKLSLEHYVSVTAWNYDFTHDKGALQVTSTSVSVSLNMTPSEMDELAEKLQSVAKECRRKQDEKLNGRVAQLDQPAAA